MFSNGHIMVTVPLLSEVHTEWLKVLSKNVYTCVLEGGLFHYFIISKMASADSEHSNL